MTSLQSAILRDLAKGPRSQRNLMDNLNTSGSQIVYACVTLNERGLIRLDKPKEAETIRAGDEPQRIYRYHLMPAGRATVEGRAAA